MKYYKLRLYRTRLMTIWTFSVDHKGLIYRCKSQYPDDVSEYNIDDPVDAVFVQRVYFGMERDKYKDSMCMNVDNGDRIYWVLYIRAYADDYLDECKRRDINYWRDCFAVWTDTQMTLKSGVTRPIEQDDKLCNNIKSVIAFINHKFGDDAKSFHDQFLSVMMETFYPLYRTIIPYEAVKPHIRDGDLSVNKLTKNRKFIHLDALRSSNVVHTIRPITIREFLYQDPPLV